MNRRRFLSVAGAAAGGGVAAQLIRGSAEASASAAPKVGPHNSASMKLGCQRGSSDELLSLYARHGVDAICSYAPRPGPKGYWALEDVLKLREQVESHGLKLDMLPLPLISVEYKWGQKPYILLGKSPERDGQLDNICEMIRVAAQAGIPALKYNVSYLGVMRTDPTPGRGGCLYSTWDLAKAPEDLPLTEAGVVPADEMWARLTYFLERVVPVAEEYKVRLACHPQDPPLPPGGFQGVDLVLGTVEGLKRFVSICESPYHGLNFCQGTVAEMLQNPAEEVFDVIRYFGRRNKIFNVHLRNIRGRRDNFQEVWHDEGDVDMLRALRVYKEIGYPYMIMPDHVPEHEDDPKQYQGLAFAFGYIRGLLDAVAAEG